MSLKYSFCRNSINHNEPDNMFIAEKNQSKKRIKIIIASIFVIFLCSIVGIQAYQYYAPHGYILSDKMVHEPDCIAINQNEKKILTETDCFQDVYINNKYGNCPICNPAAPSLSSVQELYKQWKTYYDELASLYDWHLQIVNDITPLIQKVHSMPLTAGQYYYSPKRSEKSIYSALIELGTFNPYKEASDYEKEEYYLLGFLKEKGYSYKSPSEAVASCDWARSKIKETDDLGLYIQTAENYLNQKKNIFYLWNK